MEKYELRINMYQIRVVSELCIEIGISKEMYLGLFLIICINFLFQSPHTVPDFYQTSKSLVIRGECDSLETCFQIEANSGSTDAQLTKYLITGITITSEEVLWLF